VALGQTEKTGVKAPQQEKEEMTKTSDQKLVKKLQKIDEPNDKEISFANDLECFVSDGRPLSEAQLIKAQAILDSRK